MSLPLEMYQGKMQGKLIVSMVNGASMGLIIGVLGVIPTLELHLLG
jgi:hypothetical protein